MTKSPSQSQSEVLFQKVGNTWFVFTEIDGNMAYSALPQGMDPHSTKLELFQVIESHMDKVSKHNKAKRKPELTA